VRDLVVGVSDWCRILFFPSYPVSMQRFLSGYKVSLTRLKSTNNKWEKPLTIFLKKNMNTGARKIITRKEE